jgi:hypothetical protein
MRLSQVAINSVDAALPGPNYWEVSINNLLGNYDLNLTDITAEDHAGTVISPVDGLEFTCV